jgi:hypothetical protein
MNEESLARRIAFERERRHWSPGGLARLMTKVGCPMNQSAIWKIEHGQPRRKITVDEALAFAKVFDTTLEELLNPPELATKTALVELLSRYEESYMAATASRTSCNAVAVELEDFLAEHPDARGALVDTLRKTFADKPEPWLDDATSFLLRREQTLMPQPTRWWNFFTMMHDAYGELSDGVPNLLSAKDDKRLAAEELEAERRATRNGEHQETP